MNTNHKFIQIISLSLMKEKEIQTLFQLINMNSGCCLYSLWFIHKFHKDGYRIHKIIESTLISKRSRIIFREHLFSRSIIIVFLQIIYKNRTFSLLPKVVKISMHQYNQNMPVSSDDTTST